MKRLVILGGGESGVGAALLAKAKGYDVFVSDAGSIAEGRKVQLDQANISYEELQHTADKILNADEVIKSPGIPDKAEIVIALKQKGILVIDELEFAFRYTKGKVIAITGTNGKTTTTLLTYHLLKEAGYDVALGGNVGKSMAAQLVTGDHAWWVLEVSSFQIDGMKAFRPFIGMITNITPDHLDRYEYRLENYIQAKLNLVNNMQPEDHFIYYLDDQYIWKGLDERKPKVSKYQVSVSQKVAQGAWFDGEIMYFSFEDKHFEIDASDVALRGKHNMLNTMHAVLAATSAGLSREQILPSLMTFKNAPHRLELVGELNGVSFFNDSKATNVDAAFYALDSFKQPMIWVLGGIDKGNDYETLMPIVKQYVKGIICLGVDNSKIKAAYADVVEKFHETQSVEEVIETSVSWATAGDVVLLSPACSSFDLFKNYEDRGAQFRNAVLNKIKEAKS